MCILFLCTDDDCDHGGYKLILANNRDEMYNRPTADAEFWKDYPDIIGGIDLDPSRKPYGTWLGLTRTGKFGVLTNYRQHPSFIKPDAKGRGSLVTDYLTGNTDFKKYLQNIQETGHEYGGFNLLLGKVSVTDNTGVSVYCNMEGEDNEIKDLSSGTYVLSNRVLDYPWQKVVNGKKQFAEIVSSYDSKEQLIINLLDMLQDETRYYPGDPAFLGPRDVGLQEEFLQACSAISVKLPFYGTRTNTVILVDANGHVSFIERTLRNATDNKNHCWDIKTYEFDLTEDNSPLRK